MNRIIRHCVGAAGLMLAASSFAAGSLTVEREVTLPSDPETVFKTVGDFAKIEKWLPPVERSTLKGTATKPGAVRVLHLGGGDATVTEELLSYSNTPKKHSYSYKFLKSPLPVKNYVAVIEVNPGPDGKTSVVKWHSTFDAAGAPDDKAKEAIQGIYDAGLGQLAAIYKK